MEANGIRAMAVRMLAARDEGDWARRGDRSKLRLYNGGCGQVRLLPVRCGGMRGNVAWIGYAGVRHGCGNTGRGVCKKHNERFCLHNACGRGDGVRRA